jgi:hypothetical protein
MREHRVFLMLLLFLVWKLGAKCQDTILQHGFRYIAYESFSGYKRLLPGHLGGAMLMANEVTFPAFTKEGCSVMDKDAQSYASGIFDDASQAGAVSPAPFPPETYVDLQYAVMPGAHEQLLLGSYSPTIGATMIPFLERTVRTSGLTTVTTVKLPPSNMLPMDLRSSPTGYHLLRLMKGSQEFLVKLDTALSPVWIKKMPEFTYSYCINHVGDIYVGTASSLCKMRADGVVIWKKSYAGWNGFGTVLANADGGITVTARESASPSFSNTAVMRLDSAGNFLWGRQAPVGSLVGPITHGMGSSSLFVQHDSLRISKLSGSGAVEWTRKYIAVSLPPLNPMDLVPGPNGGFWAGYRQPAASSLPFPFLAYLESAGLILKADSLGNTGCSHDNDTLLFTTFLTSPIALPVVQPPDTFFALGSTSDFTLHPGLIGSLTGSCYDDCPDPLPTPALSYPPCSPPYNVSVTVAPGTLPLSTCYLNGVAMPPPTFGSTFVLTLSPDTNHVRIVIQRGGSCADTMDYIRVAGGPPKPDLGPDVILCPGSTVTLHAGSGYATYEWLSPSGIWIPGDSIRSVSTTGTKVVRVTDAAGCTNADTVVVLAPAPVPILGATSFCAGGGIMLSVDTATSAVSWSIGGSGPTVWASSAGTVTATGLDSLGCPFTSSVTLSTYTVSVPITGPSVICPGGDAILSLPSTSSGLLWSTGDTTPTTVVGAAGTYTATGSDSAGCLFSSSYTLPLSVVYAPGLPDSLLLCQSHTAWLTPSGPFDSLVWSDGSTSDSLWVTGPGIYAVTTFNADGCPAHDTCVVYSIPSPSAFFSYSGSYPTFSFTNFSTSSTSYSWNFGDGYGSFMTNPSHTFFVDGTWTVCLTAYNDCDSAVYCEDLVVVTSEGTHVDGIRVWPNPFTASLEVALPASWLGGEWQLFSWDGKELLSGGIISREFELAAAQLAAGHYLLRLSKGNWVEMIRVEKSR